ncbi:MAG: peptide-methionine (S)-S-oxide reductase MsrA [Bacteroidota bacterium]
MNKLTQILFFSVVMGVFACSPIKAEKSPQTQAIPVAQKDLTGLSKAYFASGCFWCVEAIFESVRGVEEVISGYAGGMKTTANYPMVSSGATKHAEAVEVYYDPEVVSYETLLVVFFGSHDPTTLNRQGPDRGTQYRSAIFYTSESEKAQAEAYIKELNETEFDGKITTEVAPYEAFYAAEDYHQDYEQKNPNQPYVRSVSIPRLKKFQAKFPDLLKEQAH